MKKKNALLLTLMLLLGATTASAALKYKGHTPSEVMDGSTINDKTFYLYNVATGQMLDKGGLWSTQPALGVGIQMTFEQGSSSGTYAMNTGFGDGKHLAFIDGSTTSGASNDYGQLYIDQGVNAGAARSFIFTKVSGYESDEYVYKVSVTSTTSTYAGTYYLMAGEVDESDDNTRVIEATTTEPTTEYGYWVIVTLQDIRDAFKAAANAQVGATAVEATNFMKDYDFARNDAGVSNWKKADGTAMQNHQSNVGSNTNLTSNTYEYSWTCTYYNYDRWGSTTTHSDKTTGTSAPTSCGTNHTYNVKSFTATRGNFVSSKSNFTYQYYVGNGYGDTSFTQDSYNSSTGIYTCKGENDETLTGASTHAQRYYGAYWTGNIHGSDGKLYQTLTVTLAPGKYRITCQGFSTDGSGKLFASVNNATEKGDKYQDVAFEKPSTVPSTYVSASKLLSSAYAKSVTIVAEQNDTITFGVIVEGGESDAWSCFDNFDISYLGKDETVLIFDENQTDIQYLNDQIDTDKAQTLYLNRPMKNGKWNSLVLPVDLTTDQVKEAFGASVLVSKLDHTLKDGKQIIFEPVALTGSRTVMEKGQLYIVKPAQDITKGKEVTSTKVSDLKASQYYKISLVTHNTTVDKAQVEGSVVASDEDGGIKHCGTYVKMGGSEENPAISAGTYILSDGTWYYNKVAVNTVKGFRGWIATGAAGSNTSIVINGVEEGVTAIEGITTDEPTVMKQVRGTYTLSGQKVSDAEETTSLPKGIYIVGGKKVVVK